jgi:hypothetical protein
MSISDDGRAFLANEKLKKNVYSWEGDAAGH